jgi:hypothetical protein
MLAEISVLLRKAQTTLTTWETKLDAAADKIEVKSLESKVKSGKAKVIKLRRWENTLGRLLEANS